MAMAAIIVALGQAIRSHAQIRAQQQGRVAGYGYSPSPSERPRVIAKTETPIHEDHCHCTNHLNQRSW